MWILRSAGGRLVGPPPDRACGVSCAERWLELRDGTTPAGNLTYLKRCEFKVQHRAVLWHYQRQGDFWREALLLGLVASPYFDHGNQHLSVFPRVLHGVLTGRRGVGSWKPIWSVLRGC